jgi:hypothetical protein
MTMQPIEFPYMLPPEAEAWFDAWCLAHGALDDAALEDAALRALTDSPRGRAGPSREPGKCRRPRHFIARHGAPEPARHRRGRLVSAMGRIRWLAWTREGLAHAVAARGRVTRTACGIPATDERLSWPTRDRCPRCMAALGLPV